MTYRDFKELARRTASDKVLGNKVFSFVKNSKIWFINYGL